MSKTPFGRTGDSGRRSGTHWPDPNRAEGSRKDRIRDDRLVENPKDGVRSLFGGVASEAQCDTAAAASSDTIVSVWKRSSANGAISDGVRPVAASSASVVPTIGAAGGSGKSAALRGIAIAAAVTPRGGPVHVYGIDCGSSGLKMLDELPHVGEIINGDDVERVGRLLRWLRDLADDRSARYAEVRAVHHRGVPEAGQTAGREAHLRPGGRHVRFPRGLRIQQALRAVGHLPAAGHRRPSLGHPPRGHRRPAQLRAGVAAGLDPAPAGAAAVLGGRLHVHGRPQGRAGPGLTARPRTAGQPRSAACRPRRQLQPGPAGARGAQAQRGHAAPGRGTGHRRSNACRTRWTWTSCPPAARTCR